MLPYRHIFGDTLMSTNEQDQVLLEALKEQATSLGISFHPNISADTLLKRIKEHEQAAEAAEEAEEEAPKEKTKKPKTRKEIRDEALKLVRINVTCMNPAKQEWDGEIFTVGNAYVETQTKYVPFNTTEGWHVPNIIYQAIKARKCQVFYNERVNGQDIRRYKSIREFAIEVLPPLTEKELKELAQRQAMAKGK